jgi:hypothetical protein
MEPRSDDSLQALTRNLEKQRAGSILRKVESQLMFMGGDMYEAYMLKKQELNWGPQNALRGARAAALVSTLKSFMEGAPQVCFHCAACCIVQSWHTLLLLYLHVLNSTQRFASYCVHVM